MEIVGTFRRTLYKSGDGYLVGLFRKKDDNKTITFTGNFDNLVEGYDYVFEGEYVVHDKYGKQFRVDSYNFKKPEEKDSLIEFLSGGNFPGIGDKKAKAIVDTFKEKTIDVIIERPEDLYMVPGLSEKNINTLHLVLKEERESFETYLFLNEQGFTTSEAKKIFKYYRSNTINVVKDNIYKVYLDIKDISFKRVDSIFLKGGDLADKKRLAAGILYIINEITFRTGGTYVLEEDILRVINGVLSYEFNMEEINDALNLMKSYIKVDGERYFNYEYYKAENYIVDKLIYLRNSRVSIKDFDKFIQREEKLQKINFSDSQKEAIKLSLSHNVSVISGGPGTGKTTIVRAITSILVKDLDYSEKDIALLAPTGRASKRLSDVCRMDASTIHRFLKWNKEKDTFQLNEYNKSNVKVVIVDEASMLDVLVFDSLLRALKLDIKVVLVGDVNQLPSVAPGNLLYDIISSKYIPTALLTDLYRQAEESSIVKLAYTLNKGKPVLEESKDLEYIETGEIIENIKKLINKDSELSSFIILAPMYKGINGIDRINQEIQAFLNPPSKHKSERKFSNTIFREGDKVLQLNNLPDENVFNGDIGYVKKIVGSNIYVNFDDNVVKYTNSLQSYLTLGYAVSIHKAQGSEFETVILPLSKTYNRMLYRKLYYTGITRAKNKLYLVGDIRALEIAASLNTSSKRPTTIKEKLIKKLKI